MTEQKRTPKFKYRAGSITATCWENEVTGKDGKTYSIPKVTLENNYKVGDEWKSNNQFDKNDLQRVILVVQESQKALMMHQDESDDA